MHSGFTINVVVHFYRECAYTEMVMPIEVQLPGATIPMPSLQVLHNRRKVNSLEKDSSTVTIAANSVLY